MKIHDYLSKSEINQFTDKSNSQAIAMLLFNWGFIGAIFYGVAVFTSPLTIIVAVILLGGRQLGLAILMHEAGHRSLFRTQRCNEMLGQWLCAYPILADCNAYASSHKEHHRSAGSTSDPDLSNYQNYPVSRDSFKRKIMRDITGQTGIKMLLGILTGKADLSVRKSFEVDSSRRLHLSCGLVVNGLMLFLFMSVGEGWLYSLWFIAFITSYPLCARIRQIAEHGAVNDLFDSDPRKHTRTTIANPLERMLFCPNHVNYHAEHHFIASVPSYRLASLHQLLVNRGFYRGDEYEATVVKGYRNVLGLALHE